MVASAAVSFGAPARCDETRICFARVELVGPATALVARAVRGGSAEFALDLAAGERLALELPIPIGAVVDLELGGAPRLELEGGGEARFIEYAPVPRLAQVPAVLRALPRPTGRVGRPRTPWPALALAAATVLVGLGLARQRGPALAIVALVGTGATVGAALAVPGEPVQLVVRDSVAAPTETELPGLLVRWSRAELALDGAWRGLVETDPPGRDLAVRGRLDAEGLRFTVSAPGAAVLTLERDVAPPVPPEGADLWWRSADGRFEGAAGAPIAAPTEAWLVGGLPLGRSARLARDGARYWRTLDAARLGG